MISSHMKILGKPEHFLVHLASLEDKRLCNSVTRVRASCGFGTKHKKKFLLSSYAQRLWTQVLYKEEDLVTLWC